MPWRAMEGEITAAGKNACCAVPKVDCLGVSAEARRRGTFTGSSFLSYNVKLDLHPLFRQRIIAMYDVSQSKLSCKFRRRGRRDHH
jgi:hypothetical protein